MMQQPGCLHCPTGKLQLDAMALATRLKDNDFDKAATVSAMQFGPFCLSLAVHCPAMPSLSRLDRSHSNNTTDCR